MSGSIINNLWNAFINYITFPFSTPLCNFNFQPRAAAQSFCLSFLPRRSQTNYRHLIIYCGADLKTNMLSKRYVVKQQYGGKDNCWQMAITCSFLSEL